MYINVKIIALMLSVISTKLFATFRRWEHFPNTISQITKYLKMWSMTLLWIEFISTLRNGNPYLVCITHEYLVYNGYGLYHSLFL